MVFTHSSSGVLENASSPIAVTEFGIVTEVRARLLANARQPIEVTELGIVRVVRDDIP